MIDDEKLCSLDLAEDIEKIRWNFGNLIYEFLTSAMDFEEAERYASNFGKPDVHKYGISPRGAEFYVADWMKFLGFEHVEVTPEEKDGGYDVIADDYIIQVKNWNKGWIGVSSLRELVGVSTVLGSKPIFFFKGNISDDALSFAEKAGVPIFSFTPETASLIGVNTLAHELASEWLQKKIWRFQFERISGETAQALQFLAESLGKVLSLRQFLSEEFSSKLLRAGDRAIETQSRLQMWKDRLFSENDSIESFIQSFIQLRDIRDRLMRNFRKIEKIIDENQIGLSLALSKIYESNLASEKLQEEKPIE